MDDPAFMLLQLQENLQFMRIGAHVLSCITHDRDGKPYWTYVLLTYDNYGNVQEYHEPFEGRAEWSDDPLEALKQLHLRVAGFVTKRLTHECYPRLRTLAQQRYDEEVEGGSLGTSNRPIEERHGPPPATSSSGLQPPSDRSQRSDPPSYQTRESTQARRSRFSHDTLSSGTRTELRKTQGLENLRTVNPQRLGPAHFPQPSPALGSETWSSGDTNSHTISPRPWKGLNLDPHNLDPQLFQEDEALAQLDRVQSTRKHFPNAGLGVKSSVSEKTRPTRQTSHINAFSIPSHSSVQPQQARTERDLSGTAPGGNAVQTTARTSRSDPLDVANVAPTPPSISAGMTDLYKSSSSNARPPVDTNALPQPSRSPSPLNDGPVTIMMDSETLTDFEEFRRDRGSVGTITRISQEVASFFNSTAAVPDGGLASLATDLAMRSPSHAILPSSPASDETVTAYPVHHRRRVTQTRYGSSETDDPLPPAAPSPPPNDSYPANAAVYPFTLVSSRSGASMQRAASGNGGRDVTVYPSDDNMRRHVSFYEGSNSSTPSLIRHAPVESHSTSEEELLTKRGGDAARTRRPS